MPRILFGPALRILPIGILALSLQRLVFAEHPVHDVKLQFVLAVVVTGLTVLRLVRRNWTRLVSEMRATPPQTFTRPPASRRPPRSPRPEPRDARA